MVLANFQPSSKHFIFIYWFIFGSRESDLPPVLASQALCLLQAISLAPSKHFRENKNKANVSVCIHGYRNATITFLENS